MGFWQLFAAIVVGQCLLNEKAGKELAEQFNNVLEFFVISIPKFLFRSIKKLADLPAYIGKEIVKMLNDYPKNE